MAMRSIWMRRVMLAGMGLALSAGLAMAAQPEQGQGPERPGARRQAPPAVQEPMTTAT
jgi:hypothetical protein